MCSSAQDGIGSVPLQAAAMTVQKIVEKMGITQYNGIEIFWTSTGYFSCQKKEVYSSLVEDAFLK